LVIAGSSPVTVIPKIIVCPLIVFCLTKIIQDAVSVGYFVSTQGRNSAVVLYGKAIRFDSGADTPQIKKPALPFAPEK
jgi:hypothetical protein